LRRRLVRARGLLIFEHCDRMIVQRNSMPEMDACPQLFWVPDRYYPSLLAVGSSPLTLGAALVFAT
jgi:hypothetical protein